MARHSTKVDVQYYHWRCNATKSHNISAEELTTCLVQAPEPGQLAVTAAAAAALLRAAYTAPFCHIAPSTTAQLDSPLTLQPLLLVVVVVVVHDLCRT
jgi:hypothetical protein